MASTYLCSERVHNALAVSCSGYFLPNYSPDKKTLVTTKESIVATGVAACTQALQMHLISQFSPGMWGAVRAKAGGHYCFLCVLCDSRRSEQSLGSGLQKTLASLQLI